MVVILRVESPFVAAATSPLQDYEKEAGSSYEGERERRSGSARLHLAASTHQSTASAS